MPQTASSVDSSGFDTILLRTGAWGIAAVLALGMAVYAAQTETGMARMRIALSEMLSPDTAPTAHAAVPSAAPSGTALAVLEAKLDRFTAERARLEARLATLEHGLEDVTGSVRRQSENVESRPAAKLFIEPPVIPSISTLPPATTLAAIPAESPPVETPPAAAPQAGAENGAPPEAVPEEIPIPRARPPARGTAIEYGVELGTASDMDALRTRWLSVKANFGPMLAGLSPVAVKDKRPGSTQLRLMAGPLKSMAAAREICAKFVAANGYCWPTRVDATDVVQR